MLAALRVGGSAVFVTRCVPLMELSGDAERPPDTVRDTDAPAVMTVRVMLGLVVVLRDRVGDGDSDIVADDTAVRETVARFDTKERVGVACDEAVVDVKTDGELLVHADVLRDSNDDGDAEPARDAVSEPLEHAVALGD